MESSLSLLAPQTNRAAGRAREPEGVEATGDPSGFARALTAVTSVEATADVSAACSGTTGAVAMAASALEAGGLPTLPQGPLGAGARTTVSHCALGGSDSADGADVAEAAAGRAAQDAVARPGARPAPAEDEVSPTASDATAALVQWMMQWSLAPQPLAEPVRRGLDIQGGAAQLLSARTAMPLGRSDPAGRGGVSPSVGGAGSREVSPGAGMTTATAVTTGLGEGTPGFATLVKAGISPDASTSRGESLVRAPLAMTTPGVAVTVEGVRTAIPLEPRGSAVPVGEVSALLPAAAQAAAAAAATAAASPAGSPVPAPAQAWIQTPVTQPGFSDEVVVALVRDVGQAEQGTHALTLHLNPEALGPVSVAIELQGNTARIAFMASEALTRHHLEAALPALNQALQDQGVSLTQGGVHEASKESLAASAAGSQASGGAGSDARQRGEAPFDGRSGYGERAPRRETEVFSVDGRAMADPNARAQGTRGPSPGRAGRLDLFA